MRFPSSDMGLPRVLSRSISQALPFSSRTSSRDVNFDNYDPIGNDGSRVLRPGRVLRSAVLTSIGVAAVCILGAECLERGLVSGLDVHRTFDRTSTVRGQVRGAVGLMEIQPMRPYTNEAGCAEDGRICICSGGFAVAGSDTHGYNLFKRMQQGSPSTACQQWRFQVGDVILVDKPASVKKEYIPAMVVATVTNSPVVHAAIVTEVPPPGVNQTAENIIITEALKGTWKQVVQNSLREIVERFPFGAISVRRVDGTKYPRFFTPDRLKKITQWAKDRVGEGFDKQMLIPFKRRFTTADRYVTINPACEDRKKAIKKYREGGGPGKWICSELVAWALAFPGGLNVDYGTVSDDCDAPPWPVQNVQPFPGELSQTDFFDPAVTWRMPCQEIGCYLAVPMVPDWAGGTTSSTTTTTTSTSTTTRTTMGTSTTTRIVTSTPPKATFSGPSTLDRTKDFDPTGRTSKSAVVKKLSKVN